LKKKKRNDERFFKKKHFAFGKTIGTADAASLTSAQLSFQLITRSHSDLLSLEFHSKRRHLKKKDLSHSTKCVDDPNMLDRKKKFFPFFLKKFSGLSDKRFIKCRMKKKRTNKKI